jgi:uncharacterized protein involved in exopolysaccharide biosynthesis
MSSPLASLFSTNGPGTMYMGLLDSRSVQDEVIDRVGLMKLYRTHSRQTARERLSDQSTFKIGTDSLLTIKVKDRKADVAAAITNAYLDSLKMLNTRMSIAQSDETRDFFNQQIEEERGALTSAETQLESTQRRTGVVQPEAQTQIGLTAIAMARAQITQLKVQRAALLRGATEANPQVQRLDSQIAQLETQEHALEAGTGISPAGAAPPAQQLPATNLDVLRAQRQVTYHNALVTSLAEQYETARLAEASMRPEFQVVDRAIAPERKSWPPRKAFGAIAIVLALMIAVAAMVMRLMWRRAQAEPQHRDQMHRLRQAVLGR